MEKQPYQLGKQQYDLRRREEQRDSRAVPGISSTTGVPVKYYPEDYKFVRGYD